MDSDAAIRYSHFFIEILTGYILLYIWYKYNTYYREVRTFEDEVDYGLIPLSGGIILWGVISLLKAIDGEEIPDFPVYELISTTNNCLILASFPFFSHGFKFLKDNRNRMYWFIGVAAIGLAIALTLIVLTRYYHYPQNLSLYKGISSILSLVMLIGLGRLFYNSFTSRRLSGMMFFACVVIFFLIVPQIIFFLETIQGNFLSEEYWDETVFLVSSSALSFILIALAFSWIAELSKDIHLNIFSTDNDDFQRKILKEEISQAELFKRIEEQLKKDQLEETSEELSSYLRNRNMSRLYYNSINIISRLARLNLNKVRGTISSETYDTERNKLREAIISTMRDAKE